MPTNVERTGKRKNGKHTKRALQAVETRNRIYESATSLMQRNGFDNITIEQISKAAKVSVGAFYHHFGSKNDILNEIFRRADDYFGEKVIGQLGEVSIDEQIVRYFVHYARFQIGLGLDHVRALYKTQSPFFISSKRTMVKGLREIIENGISRKEISSVMSLEEIVDFLFTTARGLVYSWCLHNGGFSLEDKMRAYMSLQVRALRQ